MLLRQASEIFFIPFRDGGALFFPGIQRLWVLNNLASYIWFHLDENTSKATLVSKLSENFSINAKTAEIDLTQILDHFQDEGLLEGGRPTQPDTSKEIDFFLHNGQRLDKLKYPETVASCLIEAYGFTCQIYFPDKKLFNKFQKIYHYFIVEEHENIKQKIFIIPVDHAESKNDYFEIYLNDQCVHKDIPDTQLFSIIHFIFFSNCTKHLSKQGKLMFHAAAVQKGDKTIILPANSGSGKSTLAAALSSQGWRCFTDELAVLNPKELTVIPLPIPIRIRSGSFAPLLPFYLNISDLPVYEDLNDNPIRWIILPKEHLAAKSTSTQITTLIFPLYNEKEKTALLSLDKSIALEKLAITGSSERDMTLDDAKAMVCLIEQTPCYELKFSDLQEAIKAIELL